MRTSFTIQDIGWMNFLERFALFTSMDSSVLERKRIYATQVVGWVGFVLSIAVSVFATGFGVSFVSLLLAWFVFGPAFIVSLGWNHMSASSIRVTREINRAARDSVYSGEDVRVLDYLYRDFSQDKREGLLSVITDRQVRHVERRFKKAKSKNQARLMSAV